MVQDHFLLGTTKKGFSSKGIQRQLGLKGTSRSGQWFTSFVRQWGHTMTEITLEGMIEMDEGCFTVEAPQQAHKTQKAGRESKTKSNVMIMAESNILEDLDTGKVERQCRYFKAKVLEDHQVGGTDRTLKNALADDQTIVFTDKSTS